MAPEGFAQRDRRSESSRPDNPHARVYRMAMDYADYSAAILALYYWMADEPQNLALKDSLATLYFMTGSNTQAVMIGQEILKADPTNRKNLEMVAIAYSRMGLLKQSLDYYTPLYAQTRNPKHLYQIAVLEYKLQRLGECELHARELADHGQAATETVVVTVGENQTETVKLRAVALNILGVLAQERGRKEEARLLFQQATEADPQFSLPRNNLAQLDKP
jgi:Flp pilus assembly protein TadD